MIKSDKERLETILSIWNDLKVQIDQNGITKENLLNNQFYQWAVTTPINNIGEQVYHLSSELKESNVPVSCMLIKAFL